MFRRVPQPPITPALREREHHGFWPGLIVAIIGLVLLFHGSRRLTGIETAEGGTAFEMQLVKAYASGGLQFASHLPPKPPPKVGDDPAQAAQELERWARENKPPTWKVRVDTAAKTPCPT